MGGSGEGYSEVARLSARIEDLAERMDVLQGEGSSVADLVSRILRSEKVSDMPEFTPTTDQLWLCKSCRHRLGTYSPTEDVLRMRQKDVIAFVRVGAGGSLRVICRDCLTENTLEYVPPDDPEARLDALRALADVLGLRVEIAAPRPTG